MENIITIEEFEKEKLSFNKLLHEVKNPLAVCSGYLEMLEESNEIQKRKYLQIIKSEVNRSLDIIKNYSNKKLTIEEIDLSILYDEIKNIFSNNNNTIILLDDKEIYIDADYNKLKQVFINIIKNSYEAAERDYKLLIVINTKVLNNKIIINIIDNGQGMNNQELKSIFNNFYTTKEYGTGLGIPFINEIIKLHGGKIKYKSRKNIGTKVIIELPKKKSPKTFNNSNCY